MGGKGGRGGLPPSEIEKFRELREQGFTIEEIAELTGHSKNTVSKYLRMLEEKTNNEEEGENMSEKAEEEIVPASLLGRVLKEMFPRKKNINNVLRIIEQAPEYYEANIAHLHDLLRANGFNEYEIRSAVGEFQRRAMMERFSLSNPYTPTMYAPYPPVYPPAQQSPFDVVNQAVLYAMAWSQAKDIFAAFSKSNDKSEIDKIKELILMKPLLEMFSDGKGEVTVMKLPKINPDGKVEFVDTPVKTSGAAMYEMMLPLLLLAMSGKKSDDSDKLVSTVVEIAKVLKPEQPQPDRYYELMKESLEKVESLKTDFLKSEIRRLEDKIEELKNGNKGSFEDFLDKAKKISEDLGLPLFGASDKVFDYKLESKRLELENLDKMIDHKMKLLDKIAEIEQRLEIGKAIKDILGKGIGSFAEGLGKSLGEGLLGAEGLPKQQVSQQDMAGQTQVQHTTEGRQEAVARQNTETGKNYIEELKGLTVKAIAELNKLGEKDFLRTIHDRLGKVITQ